MKMKTTLIFLTLFGIQINMIFALNKTFESFRGESHEIICVHCPFLIPVIPAEATFEDDPGAMKQEDKTSLAPVIPLEADYTESLPDASAGLKPSIPAEADFSESL